MNRENGVLKWALTVSVLLFLSGCVAAGGGSQSSGDARKGDAATSTKLQPGAYKVERFLGKPPSHKGSLIVVSKFDGGKYGVIFASKKDKNHVACSDSTGPYENESVECWIEMEKPKGDYAWERFRVGALGSQFCVDLGESLEAKFSKAENPIDIDCSDRTCICYNVAHCRVDKNNGTCDEGTEASEIDINKPQSPPSNGSGAGGSWP